MKRVKITVDREYLKQCKAATPEQNLEWLAAALEFTRAPKKWIKKR